MRVYRTITTEEITNLYRGERNKDINITKGENTHKYNKGVDYVHFFRYHESAVFFYTNHYTMNNPYVAYMVANIPNDILVETIGYGYYNGITTDIPELVGTTIPLPEYAIPRNLMKPEYVIRVSNRIDYEYERKNNEYNNYLELVVRLLEIYDYNHYTVGRMLHKMNLEEALGVVDDTRTEDEIFHDKMKEFSKIRDDLYIG